MQRIIALVIVLMLLAVPAFAKDNIYLAYQSSAIMPEDDNYGIGKAFYGQAVEVGWSLNKYLEIGAEYYLSKWKSVHASTFWDNSIMGTAKVKYTLPWKWCNRWRIAILNMEDGWLFNVLTTL